MHRQGLNDRLNPKLPWHIFHSCLECLPLPEGLSLRFTAVSWALRSKEQGRERKRREETSLWLQKPLATESFILSCKDSSKVICVVRKLVYPNNILSLSPPLLPSLPPSLLQKKATG